jgi:hypothetical protein
MSYLPENPTPDQKRILVNQFKNNLVVAFVFYMGISFLFPFWISVAIFIHLIVGEQQIRKSLVAQGATMDRMGETFTDALKMHTMNLVWPLTLKVLKERQG